MANGSSDELPTTITSDGLLFRTEVSNVAGGPALALILLLKSAVLKGPDVKVHGQVQGRPLSWGMEAFLALFGLVALAFASTNLDNLLLLVGWQLGGSVPAGRLFAGYALGMSGVLVISVMVGLVGYLFPLDYLGYLGFIPILLGLRLVVGNLASGAEESPAPVSASGSVLAIAAMQLSNGVDTVLVFAPLLADSRLIFDAQIAVLFVVLFCLWFLLARLLGGHVNRLPAIERLGHWLAPLVMIGVGFYILSNTATDMG
jgi:cadmium resistance protein CadD (predicted permease)